MDVVPKTGIPIVIDNGSGSIKAGLAGSDKTISILSLAGAPKHARVMLKAPRTEKYFGDDAFKYRGLCKLSYPIVNGKISNWNDMIQLWQYLYNDILEIQMKEHPVLITEVPNNPISNRSRMTQIYLEYFDVPSIYITPPSVLTLYSSGRLSGCIVDSGHGVTTCMPIVDGYSLPHAITRMDVGGYDITQYLAQILNKCGDYRFETSSELEFVRTIKERESMVREVGVNDIENPNYHSIGFMGVNSRNGNSLSSKLGKLSAFQGISMMSKSSSSLGGHHNMSAHNNGPQWELPDGTTLNVGNTHERCAEILFDSAIIGYDNCRGVQHCVINAIAKCDKDLRNKLYDSIYLSGGNCNITGFDVRLRNELKKRIVSKKHNSKLKIRKLGDNKKRELLAWTGGSLLASTDGFIDMWINKKEWDEFGVGILYRKSLF